MSTPHVVWLVVLLTVWAALTTVSLALLHVRTVALVRIAKQPHLAGGYLAAIAAEALTGKSDR